MAAQKFCGRDILWTVVLIAYKFAVVVPKQHLRALRCWGSMGVERAAGQEGSGGKHSITHHVLSPHPHVIICT